LDNEVRRTNVGRHKEREAIHREMAAVTSEYLSKELGKDLAEAKIPHAPIRTVYQVREMDAIAGKLTRTRTPDGKRIHLSPLATDLDGAVTEYSFAPRYGENTQAILREAGLSREDIAVFERDGIIPS
jgi:crotonobetainyl-CoA:carnitine CoA-transferase CaiB-like acyl-CoA transferase